MVTKPEREARQTRPQLIIVVADNSSSMAGSKAQAATMGIREMLMECQTRGPQGPDRSYFLFLMVRFGSEAEYAYSGQATPVRKVEPNLIEVKGDGGLTNMAAALQLTLDALQKFMHSLQKHPECAEHPVPLVVFFSDGQNNVGDPLPVAEQIKALKLDGDPVVIAAAGVSVGGGDPPDEQLLRQIASPGCYASITRVTQLNEFISTVGSSGASRPEDVARIIEGVTGNEG